MSAQSAVAGRRFRPATAVDVKVGIEIDPSYRRLCHVTALIRELGKYSEKPLFDEVVSGSERDMFLRTLGAERLDLDNHPTDPHVAPLLMTLGRVETDPVELVEIPSGLTARLRDA